MENGNNVIEIIRNRVSLRKYADRPVSEAHLDVILESAMRAPTAGGMMLYSILTITDPEKKERLSVTCDNQPFIARAPLVLIFLADFQRWFDYYRLSNVKEFCDSKGLEFRAPGKGEFLLAAADAIIAAQTAAIAAESLGIGSCYIGDITENYEIHRDILDLPPWAFPVAMLCMGYYPEGRRRAPSSRFDRKYIVFKDNYHRLEKEQLQLMFAGWEKQFRGSDDAHNLGQHVFARKTGADFSREMNRSVAAALRNWDHSKL